MKRNHAHGFLRSPISIGQGKIISIFLLQSPGYHFLAVNLQIGNSELTWIVTRLQQDRLPRCEIQNREKNDGMFDY